MILKLASSWISFSYLAATIYIDEQWQIRENPISGALFEVENDISDILDHAVDALKLVLNAVDLNRGDRSTFDRAKKHAT